MSGFVRINIDDGQLGFISGAGKDFPSGEMIWLRPQNFSGLPA